MAFRAAEIISLFNFDDEIIFNKSWIEPVINKSLFAKNIFDPDFISCAGNKSDGTFLNSIP